MKSESIVIHHVLRFCPVNSFVVKDFQYGVPYRVFCVPVPRKLAHFIFLQSKSHIAGYKDLKSLYLASRFLPTTLDFIHNASVRPLNLKTLDKF